MEQLQRLTGHGYDADNGIVEVRSKYGVKSVHLSAITDLTSDDLPLALIFRGRRYVLRETRGGGLLLNGS